MAERYYEKKPVKILLPLAAQLIVDSAKLNSGFIGGLEIVVCDGDGIKYLPEEAIADLEAKCEERGKAIRVALDGEIAVDKDKFDAALRALINAPPTTFRDVAAKPKPRKDGGIKRSAKRSG